ncbi:unnamed protein product [Bursaphelenchus okinawaensis]|uniref:Ribosomal_L7Ae domain-containing protein n=1 Tax=Bursaphelenchus okinawaensis TaxID=465554 RepID=A0A811K284_9BILA|nr:unnamed protein product [Bursaphelenchus okinawaensis]CAG9089656.1 unnamed protein product [Bursaphelenchus okinawaensis]
MAKPKILKPYIKSAVKSKSNWTVLTDLSDLKAVVSDSKLARKTSKGLKRRLKAEEKAGTSSEVVKEQDVEMENIDKPKLYIGMRTALRQLNENNLGAIIIDEKVIAPSAVAQVFDLVSCNRSCDFYKATALSEELKSLLNMPKVSCIGIGKDEPLVIQLELTAETKVEVEKLPPTFAKPEFKHPKGKNKHKKKKM